MTAELSDAFRTKREGVAFVLDAAQDALGDRPLSVLTTAGELVSVAAARARPWDVAAANWVATALAVAQALTRRAADRRRQHDRRRRPDRRRPRRGDRAQRPRAAAGRRARLHRRRCARTSRRSRRACRSAASGARWRRSTSRSAPTSISSSATSRRRRTTARRPTAAPATVEFARERIARLVCSDAEQLDAERDRRDRGLPARRAAARGSRRRRAGCSASCRPPRPSSRSAPAPSSGARSPRVSGDRSPTPAPWSATGEVAPAAALAALLAARAVLTRRQGRRRPGRGAGDDALRALCTTLGELGERHPLLVVPGGAWFADAVRDADRRFGLRAATSHHMAILGMEQFGWLLSDLIPGAVRCADPALAPTGRTTVLLPAALPIDVAARVVAGDLRLDRRLGRRSGPAPAGSCSSRRSTACSPTGRLTASRSRA